MPKPAPRRDDGPQPRRISILRYVDASGKQVPKGTPGAKQIREQSSTYYVKFKGKRWPLETTDLQQAWANFRALQKRLRDEELGIHTPAQDQAALPLARHLSDFLDHLRAKGTGAHQIATYRQRIANVAGLAGWKRITDMTREKADHALARLMTEQGRSQQTRNHCVTHLKAFASWLVDAERLARNPLRKLARIAVTEYRHKRRTPTDDEIRRLAEATDRPGARVRGHMTGPQRMLAYRLAMATGFRFGEVRTLARECFDLDAAAVTLPARRDKRRKGVRQPLPAWLVDELRAWFAAGGGCWAFPRHKAHRILRADLKAAGVPYTVAGPECELFFDFGSLRRWYVSRLAEQPGIDPKTLMELARHSTADLTLRVYMDGSNDRRREAVNNIARPGDQSPSVAPPVAPTRPTASDNPGRRRTNPNKKAT
jgi:integrase